MNNNASFNDNEILVAWDEPFVNGAPQLLYNLFWLQGYTVDFDKTTGALIFKDKETDKMISSVSYSDFITHLSPAKNKNLKFRGVDIEKVAYEKAIKENAISLQCKIVRPNETVEDIIKKINENYNEKDYYKILEDSIVKSETKNVENWANHCKMFGIDEDKIQDVLNNVFQREEVRTAPRIDDQRYR